MIQRSGFEFYGLKMFKFLSFINIIFYFVNVLFIFILMFDLMLILLKNNVNGNKNNFGTAVLIQQFLGVKL